MPASNQQGADAVLRQIEATAAHASLRDCNWIHLQLLDQDQSWIWTESCEEGRKEAGYLLRLKKLFPAPHLTQCLANQAKVKH